MSSVPDTTRPVPASQPAPSVFISYASEDRTAARTLRDTLTAAGLDVWYDENELGGGDAWDQKIRRQIRDCEYFMPVISATTEARKEGYFRREWRLATDRSLDMADDVLFLIPVTIDGTSENGARVPDKFLTVQWLRLPGGQPTPALHHLVRRVLSGNHHALTRPPMAFYRPPPASLTEPPIMASPPISPPPTLPHRAGASPDTPPPMPPFPTRPENRHERLRYFAEVNWWVLTTGWMLFNRAPRWVRIVITIWLVISLFSTRSCKPAVTVHDPETQQTVKVPLEQIARAAREARKNGNTADLAHLGAEIAREFTAALPENTNPSSIKRLLLVPFSKHASEDPGEKFASAVFASLYGELTLAHAREVGLFRQPALSGSDPALIARAKQTGSAFVLAGHMIGEGDDRALTVRLLVTEDGSTKWVQSYPLTNAEPSEVADKIAEKLADILSRRDLPPRPKP